MKRNYLIPTPDWTSKTSVLTAACRVCGLSLGELRERLKKQSLCEVTADLLSIEGRLLTLNPATAAETLERWEPGSNPSLNTLLHNLFIETNPLRSARRSSGRNVTEFARMLGISRQRLHVLEHATGGEALLRACARASAHNS